jgi:RNA polymerase sigma-70 factor, ECF subfamily
VTASSCHITTGCCELIHVRIRLTDEDLLTSGDPEAFGVFYARHSPGVEAYFARRVGKDHAADLAAETFASALVARRRFVRGDTPAVGWLYTIAARRLVDFHRRGLVEMRTREALASHGALVPAWTAPPSAALAPDLDAGLLRHLPPEQRTAIRARFADDRDYSEIASDSGASEASVRQRVSRGLSTLRGPLRIYRAAQELARQDRRYRLGGGHGKALTDIGPREPLDCSSSASLLLMHGGALVPGPAWTSGRFAAEWGQPGEGRYITVWANDEHIWIEFRLDGDHGERFDPTPSRLAPHSGSLRTTAAPRGDFTPRHWPGL